MNKVIGVTEMQRRFRSVFDEVAKRNIPYILTRGSRPEAALISYEDFLLFQQWQESDILARFDRLLKRMASTNASYSRDEIIADIESARNQIQT